MKPFIAALLALLMCASNLKAEPSLKETLDWLVIKVEGSAGYSYIDDRELGGVIDNTTKYRLSFREETLVTLTRESRDVQVYATEVTRHTYTFNLADLNPDKVKVSRQRLGKKEEVFWVVDIRADTKVIRTAFTVSWENVSPRKKAPAPEVYEPRAVDATALKFRSEDLANRVAKALVHAVKSSKTKEPF